MRRVLKVWKLLPHDESAINRLARELNLSPLVAQLLLNRQISSAEKARAFLKAPLTNLLEPERTPGVAEAADRLFAAVRDKRAICIYGDYDVDGTTGTAILIRALRLIGGKVHYHVPDRLQEGYGLNTAALKSIADQGISVVVTVDCGIASVAEVAEGRDFGLEIIVTDHHEFKSLLPEADVLVHPRLGDVTYPESDLSGAGVAFKLAWALCKKASGSNKVTSRLREFLLDAVVLASLGAVADVMPLQGENRVFVRHGLERLRGKPSEGLKALLGVSNLTRKPKLAASDIGFGLAPRINAAGRLGSARTAVDLLTTALRKEAEDLADQLDHHNQQRQEIERRILQEARQLVEDSGLINQPALVVANSNWHPGLIGIVAGRLTEIYGRPSLMISQGKDQNLAVGSGRSIPGFKLHKALEACSQHLEAFGGHAAAAGFKLRLATLETFRHHFCTVATQHFGGTIPQPKILIDAEAPLTALTPRLVESMSFLEPYGEGNPEPVMMAADLEVVGEPKLLSEGRHLSFRVRQQKREIRAVAFNMGDRLEELMSGGRKCCLVFTPQLNRFQGFRSVELLVRDLQPGSEPKLEVE